MRIASDSPEATEQMAFNLAQLILPGDFIALHGQLGAGKTRFAGGIAKGLGVDPALPVTSPTYTLLNIYQGRIPLYHFDLYRLHGDDDILDLGFTEYFAGDGVCLVEWAERLEKELPPARLDIYLSHIDENIREIVLVANTPRYVELIAMLSHEAEKRSGV
jgi:tRNA threonylcarbamoyladenosine biosynthesis protein TsaE